MKKDTIWLLGLVTLIATVSMFARHSTSTQPLTQPSTQQSAVPAGSRRTHIQTRTTHVDWTQPFNIDGIELGMTRQQVENVMGSPGTPGSSDSIVEYNGTTIAYDKSNQVIQLSGRTLSQRSGLLLAGTDAKSAAFRLLGKPSIDVQGTDSHEWINRHCSISVEFLSNGYDPEPHVESCVLYPAKLPHQTQH
jgi:hypothetical protein